MDLSERESRIFAEHRHLCRILSEWVRHYNAARPHTALGPGIPEPGPELPTELQSKRHELPTGARVTAGRFFSDSLQLAA
jgi:transposase InsO family protein